MKIADADESAPFTGIGLPPQVASYMGITTNRLARLRSDGQGPAWLKIGKSVRYRWVDVHRFVEENLRVATEGAAESPDELARGDAGEVKS
jgi:hypothetical protein